MGNAVRASSTPPINRDHLQCVQGEIAFARRTWEETAPEVVTPEFDQPLLRYDVTVRNARPIANELSLDREGFALIQHRISCPSERDPEILRGNYLKEMVPFIKNYFDASWVVPQLHGGIIFCSAGGRFMTSTAEERDHDQVRRDLAGFAHIDYSPIAGPMIAAREDQLQGVQIRPYSRLLIIQAWHVLSPGSQEFPLAFCDGASVFDTDLAAAMYARHGMTHKTWLLHYNPFQRWYYFPNMTQDEFVISKGYDSEDNWNPRSAHSAFSDRHDHPDVSPHESIEARFFVYYD